MGSGSRHLESSTPVTGMSMSETSHHTYMDRSELIYFQAAHERSLFAKVSKSSCPLRHFIRCVKSLISAATVDQLQLSVR